MKKSPLKRHMDNSRSPSKSKLSATSSISQNTSSVYFCHYKNAMYMGGIKAFKKDGKGILLHDSGISAITSYLNDQLHGHNIYFDNYSLLSAYFNKNKLTQCAYRTQGFLAYLNYNSERQLQGKCILMNYITKTIIYSHFKKGNLTDKSQQTDPNIVNKVFDLGQIDFLIGRIHAKTIKYQFQKIPLIEFQKQGNRFIFGFEKNGFINGLGFSYIFRGSHGGYNIDTHRNQDDFELRLAQRGYYINTQLHGMGQKMFKNGNIYIGQFKNSIFQGHGILKNNEKSNWVSGIFKDGNLVELTEYKSQGQDKAYIKIIESMHERKTNWINNEISFLDFNIFIDQIEKIIKNVPNKQIKSLEERKQEVLKKIQEKFISQTNSSFDAEINESLSKLKKSGIQNSGPGNQPNNSFSHNESSSLRKKVLIDHDGSSISFKQNSPQKVFSNTNVKYKIFDKAEQDQAMNRGKSQPLQYSSKKKKQHSPGLIKGNDFDSSGKKQYSYYFNHPLFSNENSQGQTSKPSKRGLTQGNSYVFPLSSDRNSSQNKTILDSKKLVAKNKIFKYLQQQQKSPPQFNYLKIDEKNERFPAKSKR